ncbi:MAG: hypothetical protein UX91_C0003G0028 [Candidatus Amesbacteria bacterium GW2011_GWB1_47_19]|nr:MAG: hypothetical protein UW51_C0003G0034 [Candidatus Amesbacteria bacterium GW2011_GWA1_44_24]KKU31459.1 MAG: hypothetical protein UX46_C0005G0028 [Candidatus Amesbacteria bacterium GW2011_GWC1_46_24]KKU67467.1 MAG: hypothetical protein UX91_C0003G0028 [Candidatus Amesbacteria bacterium GW2011_GWB1_47_19]
MKFLGLWVAGFLLLVLLVWGLGKYQACSGKSASLVEKSDYLSGICIECEYSLSTLTLMRLKNEVEKIFSGDELIFVDDEGVNRYREYIPAQVSLSLNNKNDATPGEIYLDVYQNYPEDAEINLWKQADYGDQFLEGFTKDTYVAVRNFGGRKFIVRISKAESEGAWKREYLTFDAGRKLWIEFIFNFEVPSEKFYEIDEHFSFAPSGKVVASERIFPDVYQYAFELIEAVLGPEENISGPWENTKTPNMSGDDLDEFSRLPGEVTESRWPGLRTELNRIVRGTVTFDRKDNGVSYYSAGRSKDLTLVTYKYFPGAKYSGGYETRTWLVDLDKEVKAWKSSNYGRQIVVIGDVYGDMREKLAVVKKLGGHKYFIIDDNAKYGPGWYRQYLTYIEGQSIWVEIMYQPDCQDGEIRADTANFPSGGFLVRDVLYPEACQRTIKGLEAVLIGLD